MNPLEKSFDFIEKHHFSLRAAELPDELLELWTTSLPAGILDCASFAAARSSGRSNVLTTLVFNYLYAHFYPDCEDDDFDGWGGDASDSTTTTASGKSVELPASDGNYTSVGEYARASESALSGPFLSDADPVGPGTLVAGSALSGLPASDADSLDPTVVAADARMIRMVDLFADFVWVLAIIRVAREYDLPLPISSICVITRPSAAVSLHAPCAPEPISLPRRTGRSTARPRGPGSSRPCQSRL